MIRGLGLWLVGRLMTKDRVTKLMLLLEQLMLNAAKRTATPVDDAVLQGVFDAIDEDQLADLLEGILKN